MDSNNEKLTQDEEKAQSLRTLGIIWFVLGIASPLFFILGIISLIQSVTLDRRIMREYQLPQAGGSK